MSCDESEIRAALTVLAREEGARVLALLAGRLGDVDLADEAVQDALTEAVEQWPRRGIPDNPAGWLFTVARNKAVDRLRREASARRRADQALDSLARTAVPVPDPAAALLASADDLDDDRIDDDRLRLVILCCHPSITLEAQVALTLRLVGGLTTAEIAAAFLVPEATLAQRISRAKRKIREARIPLRMPSDPTERLSAVCAVLYLIFNEGYLPRTGGDGGPRVELTTEAVRLTRLLTDLVPAAAEVRGLLALELFHTARAAGRLDCNGDLVLLEDQDRTRWDQPTIAEANRVLAQALRCMQPGPYQMQAYIAALHTNAPSAVRTDWPAIAAAYTQLVQMQPSAVIQLNRAVAIALAESPTAGLAVLATITGLENYHLFHSTLAELLRLDRRPAEAAIAYERAITLAANPAERRLLIRRRDRTTPAK